MARHKDWVKKLKQKKGDDLAEPTVEPSHQWLWQAFCFLSVRRLVIQGASQSIQMSEIESYHRYHGLPEGWRKKMFARVMDRLDSVYLEAMRKRAKQQSSKGGSRQMKGAGVK